MRALVIFLGIAVLIQSDMTEVGRLRPGLMVCCFFLLSIYPDLFLFLSIVYDRRFQACMMDKHSLHHLGLGIALEGHQALL